MTSRDTHLIVVAVVAAVVYVALLQNGWSPIARKTVLWPTLAGLAVGAVGRPVRHTAGLVRDWVPLVIALSAYDLVRKSVDDINTNVAVGALVNWESTLSLGLMPARSFFEFVGRERPVPLAIVMDLVWMSHFFVPLLFAGWLWVRHRDLYLFYASMTCLLFLFAVAVYFAMPSAPPWYAAANGFGADLANLERTTGSGLASFGADFVRSNMERGINSSNPFAAFPSLHAGCSIVVAAMLSRRVPGFRWRRAIWLYPAAMSFTIVATGEHYLIDVWAVIPFVWLAWKLAERVGPWWGSLGGRYLGEVTTAPRGRVDAPQG